MPSFPMRQGARQWSELVTCSRLSSLAGRWAPIGDQASCTSVAAAVCWLQAECEDARLRVEGLQEELQLSRSSAGQLRQDKEAAEAALHESREDVESLRTDVGRSNFRLGDMQETVHRLQVLQHTFALHLQ